MLKFFFYAFGITLAFSCSKKNKLPKEKYYQFQYKAGYSYTHDTLTLHLANPLDCPLRVSISSPDRDLLGIISAFGSLVLKEKTDTVLQYYLKGKKGIHISFNSVMGDPAEAITKEKISVPFPKNREYRVIQGYNGSHSHNTDYARYAIDFSLRIGDTVCSADYGYVVGVVKDYKLAGSTTDWIDYSNFITVYHPKTGLFTQYVHLANNGSFVKLGDTVLKGQPIGLSGMTGYTTAHHLHFSVLKPVKEGLISTDIEFEEGYRGSDLTEDKLARK